MPLTEDEFRALLVERSAETPAGHDRLAGVRRRVARRHRTQAVVAAVAVLAAAVGVGVPLLGADREPAPVIRRPAPVVHPAATPPPYANGGKLIASGTLHSPRQNSVTVTFVPTDWRLSVWSDFVTDWPQGSSDLVIRVNGHLLLRGGNGRGAVGVIKGREREIWSSHGVRLGQPSTVTFTVVRNDLRHRRPPAPLPVAERPTGIATVGVYQGVPLAEYPLPSPPSKLPRFERVYGALATLDSRKVGATGRWTLPARAGQDFQLVLQTVAPGEVRILVDGHLVEDHESWDYSNSGSGLQVDLHPQLLRGQGVRVREGQRVTVTVEASRFTVPGWRVVVQDTTR